MKKVFFESKSDGLVRCLACRHYCVIADGKFGLCGARKNIAGKLVLLTTNKPCSVHLDPIEKKPLYHFLPGTKTMSFGFYGCNFHCDFCQNYDISNCKGEQLEKATKQLQTLTAQQAIELTKNSGAKSVAITYNEPAISIEWDLELFELAKKKIKKEKKQEKEKKKQNYQEKLSTVFVSNGYSTKESIRALKGKLDAINIDLKSFNENFYRNTCGASLEKVLECIKYYKKTGTWIELTTLIIPGKNNSFQEINSLTKWIASLDKEIPWHVSAFHPMHKMLDVRATTELEVRNAISIGLENGLKYVYGGNLATSEFSHTFCPKCGTKVIDRSSYVGVMAKLKISKGKAKCINCGQKIKGLF